MSNILPAILAKNEKDLREKISAASEFAESVQIDVLDGTLYKATCWADPEAIAALPLPIPFDAHLMVAKPEDVALLWVKAGAKRIVVQRDAPGNLGKVLEQVRKLNREFGLAINPEIDLAELEEFIPFLDYVLVLGVPPGAQGRTFDPDTIGRVRNIRAKHPNLKIGVDGGITDSAHLAHELAAAGADELVVGSSLWRVKDPAAAYRAIAEDAVV
jgi:ribulose-phosphate 3-epimerase